jgi:hypothetical protein
MSNATGLWGLGIESDLIHDGLVNNEKRTGNEKQRYSNAHLLTSN